MTRPMSAGVMSSSASAPATDRLTTRQSLSTSSGPPTQVSTSTAPPGWVTTKPCTGQSRPSTPRRLARCNRLISSDIGGLLRDRVVARLYGSAGPGELPPRDDLHRVAIGVGNPGGAQRAEKVVRRAQRAYVPGRQGRVRPVDVVGPRDHFSPGRARPCRDPVHLAQRIEGREAQRELAKAQLDMGRRAILGRAERLREPERLAVEARRHLDVLDVEIDLQALKHRPRSPLREPLRRPRRSALLRLCEPLQRPRPGASPWRTRSARRLRRSARRVPPASARRLRRNAPGAGARNPPAFAPETRR